MNYILTEIQEFIRTVDSVVDGGVIGISFGELTVATAVFLLFLVLRRLFSRIVLSRLVKWAERTESKYDDMMVQALHGPVRLVFVVFGLFTALRFLTLSEEFSEYVDQLIRSLIAFGIFWTIYRLIDPLSHVFDNLSPVNRNMSEDLRHFFVKTVHAIVVIVGGVAILQEWGFNVTGFVASLGLVGMAVALAAKDSVANLFGSLTLFLDRTMKKGDWVETPDIEGVVEEIGLRSSRIRTFAKALVTVPNANLAGGAVTNWSRMTNRRIKMTIGLEYRTPRVTIERILERLRTYLKENPDIRSDAGVPFMINLHTFGASSIDIFMYFFTHTTNWAEYMKIREDCMLAFMRIVEEEGAAFAFPSQSVYLESLPAQSSLAGGLDTARMGDGTRDTPI